MAVTYESDGGTVFAASASNAAVTVPLPATRPVGSVLYLICWSRLITDTGVVAPGGFGLLPGFPISSGTASGGRIWVYARVVTGAEGVVSFNTTGAVTGNSGDLWGACMVCYSGVDTTGGAAGTQAQLDGTLDGSPTFTDASGTTVCTYPALSIANDNSMLVRFLARFRDAADTFTPTATWNEREDLGSTVRTGAQFHLQDKLATASGSQAAVTVAPSNTTAARYLAVTLALKSNLRPALADTVSVTDSVSSFMPPSGAYASAVMADAPAAYYRMGEASGQPQDSSGNGNHTTVTTGTPTYGQSGAITDGDTGIRLLGTAGNGFSAPDHSTLDLGDVLTLEAWIKLAATGQYHTIVSKGFTGGAAYNLRISNGNRLQFLKAGTAVIVDSTTTITDTTTWHHVVVTKNGATVKLYIDGADVTGTVTNATLLDNAQALFLGRDQVTTEQANATLDEIAVYPTALSAARVSAHYAAATAAPPLEQDIDDTLALADALSFAFDLHLTDTLALADAQSFQRSVALAIPDTLAVADAAPAVQRGIAQAIPDSLTLDDLATTQSGKSASIPDTLSLSDAQAFGIGETIADTLSVADAAPTFQRDVSQAIPDTLALADATTLQRTLVLADTLAVADSTAQAAGKGVSIPDTLALADSLSSAGVFQLALPDTLALADSTALAVGWALTIPDTVALTDALAQVEEIHIGDTLALSDLVDPVKTVGGVAHSQPIPDTLALADSLTSASVFQLPLADTATPTDALRFDRGLTQLETLAVADSLGSQAAFLRTVADTLALADALSSAGTGAQTIADTLALADSLSSQAAFLRTVADTVALSDLADPVKTVGGTDWTQPLSDTLALSDTLRLARGLGLADAVALADALSLQGAYLLALADTLGLADMVATLLEGIPSEAFAGAFDPDTERGRGSASERSDGYELVPAGRSRSRASAGTFTSVQSGKIGST